MPRSGWLQARWSDEDKAALQVVAQNLFPDIKPGEKGWAGEAVRRLVHWTHHLLQEYGPAVELARLGLRPALSCPDHGVPLQATAPGTWGCPECAQVATVNSKESNGG